jgi:hypothetical protein
MKLIRTLWGCAWGGLAMLVLAGATVPPDGPAVQDGANPPNPPTTNPPAAPPAIAAPAGGDPCAADQDCMDRYLWALYQRTPKRDTVNVQEQTQVEVKRKGKTRTVTRTVSKPVGEDFGWKDPKAAEVAGMPLMEYVIGGMDREFRVTLYHALHALDDKGFMPGIMCAFRDDYRQSIATGLKAQNDRSYHGGSFRGGYGHGQAADIVSVKGADRIEQLASTQQMWEYIDAHETELGIGRPYLDRDPPHVGALDGAEYSEKRLLPKLERTAAPEARRNQKPAVHIDRDTSKRNKTTSTSRTQAKIQVKTQAKTQTKTPVKPQAKTQVKTQVRSQVKPQAKVRTPAI